MFYKKKKRKKLLTGYFTSISYTVLGTRPHAQCSVATCGQGFARQCGSSGPGSVPLPQRGTHPSQFREERAAALSAVWGLERWTGKEDAERVRRSPG